MAGRLGKPAVASWSPDRLDVFLRSDDGSLLHSWFHGDRGATINLGGKLASDPVAVSCGADSLSVFARGADQSLLHWVWEAAQSRMVGPTNRGWLATDPVAVCWRSRLPIFVGPGRAADVLARSVDGPLRHWWRRNLLSEGPLGTVGLLWELDTVGRSFDGDPVPVSHAENELDVFVRSTDNHQLEQWQWDGSALTFGRLLGGRLVSDPVAVSWAANRIDVFARTDDGRLKHWGWDGRLTGRWFGPEEAPGITEPLVADPVVASRGEDDLDLFVRTTDGTLQHWSWDAGARRWLGRDNRGFNLASDPVAVSRAPGTLDVFARARDGGLLHWTWDGAQWADGFSWSLAVPPPPEIPWTAGQDSEPDLLLLRPRDHVVLGVHWSGCQLIDEVPPVLEPTTADAQVVLTFPPQHIAEEVAPADGPLVPTIDPATTSGFSVWQARLARPSRLAIAVQPGSRIVLTAQGLLEALDRAQVLPGSRDPKDDLTAIELPWGLIVSPESGALAGEVHTAHPSRPVELGSGAVGLWRTRLQATNPATGFALRALHADGADPFQVPLTGASRLIIFQQPAPATAARLELSSLGGSLSASGRWDTFEWDHDATVGRDRTVRTLARGVLYPLGHRAEYVELTERVIDPGASPPIAVLRKKTILKVTEPVRAEVTGDDTLSRAFPFSEVEITTLTYTDLRPPEPPDSVSRSTSWRAHTRPALEMAQLEMNLAQIQAEMRRLHDDVHGEMGWSSGPVMEDLADERPEAADYLMWLDQFRDVQDRMKALEELGGASEDLPVFFWPSTLDGVPIRFPVRCAAANGSLHFELPLIFVQDWRLDDGDLRAAFHSLTDVSIATRLGEEYKQRNAGVVQLPGTPIDLVRSGRSPRPPGDVQEVHRLNLVAVAHAGGFRPRLGPPLLGERPDPQAWGVDVALPAMRSLLGADPAAARIALAFARAYVANGEAEDLAFQVAGEALNINFSGVADRAGGLVSPVLDADAISRAHGLINLAGARSLDPAELLADGASLLGFDLRSLVGQVSVPPAIVTDLVTGQPPVVKMIWDNVPLRAFPDEQQPVFRPGAGGATLTMTVLSSPSLNETTCVVRNFSLAMPPGADALLELSFGSLTFTQTTGRPPILDVSGVDARFVGKLKLLQVLQDSVGLGAAAPKIDVSGGGIAARYSLPVPDVSLLAFTMRNLVFNAAVSVPFTGDPVSVSLGFGNRERPFTLSVLMFGGGGYVDVEIIHTGLRRLEVSLEFGAAVAIGIGIATAEVHALGGIRYAMLPGGAVTLTGYIRIGGSVELLGLVSVSVELRVALDYRSESNRLVGRARLVIEIDLTLYSDSIELDSGDWVIAGGPPAAPPVPSPPGPSPLVLANEGLDVWAEYLRKFR